MVVQISRKKFTVEQYHQMIESRILTDRDRVELIGGEIIEMSPVGRRHAACVDRLTELFVLQLASRVIVRTQNPIRLSDESEPQPDLALPRRQKVKIPLYATEGLAEVWLVHLNAEVVEVYRQPTPEGYQSVQSFGRGRSLSIGKFPDVQFTVDQLLG